MLPTGKPTILEDVFLTRTANLLYSVMIVSYSAINIIFNYAKMDYRNESGS